MTTAAALKIFSSFNFAKRLYRLLGNTIGAQKRAKGNMPQYYIERVNDMLRLSRMYGFPKDGDSLIELGTGWLHWEAITTRLFFNIDAVLFDVWDNRQLAGLQNYLSQFCDMIEKIEVDDEKRQQARILIKRILKISSLEDLYKVLGFQYTIDSRGRLDNLEKGSFDIVVSKGVLEHININVLPEFVNGISALLKPGGYSIHSISLRDHLYGYDRSVSVKQYLRFSDKTWKLFFENDIQYINRVQRSDWLELFRSADLQLIEEVSESGNIVGLRLSKDYQQMDMNDFNCIGLNILHRKA